MLLVWLKTLIAFDKPLVPQEKH
jgi:hypothetical protein